MRPPPARGPAPPARGGSYGAAPRTWPAGKARGGQAGLSLLERVALASVPPLVFAVACALFATVFHWAPALVALLAVAGFALGGAQLRLAWDQRAVPSVRFYLALECVAAIATAALVGVLVYNRFLSIFWTCSDSHVYTNVLPSDNAAGYADAGKIVFADEARLDKNHSLGHKDRHIYCVAPIVDDDFRLAKLAEQMPDAVQFWAVGLDCCGARAAFGCDDAWDFRARSGLVIRGSEWHSQYLPAVRQAEAAFGLPRGREPVFVRWLRDPEKMELDYWRVGTGILFGAAIFHLILSLVAAWLINRALKGNANWTMR